MMTDLADRTSRPTTRRVGGRKPPASAKAVGLPASSVTPVQDADKNQITVAADVMAVLAAFGLED